MNIRHSGLRATALAAATLAASGTHAQSVTAGPTLAPVTVHSSGFGQPGSELGTPSTVLEGDELVRRREATLGDTLDGEPGIHATHFGAGASRPVIRGMDGPRVRLLSDGSEIQDASTVSPDHAVASEPLLAGQIEVLRGPSTLLYGAGLMGGVVNVLDRKVPTAVPARGVEGSVELRGSSAAREAAGAFALTGGAGPIAVHAEGVQRDAADYRVGSGWVGGPRVPGSFQRSATGSLGLSWVGDRGYLGLAYTEQRNRYGLPGHAHAFEGCEALGNRLQCPRGSPEHEGEGAADHPQAGVPVVQLRSQRWDLRGELRNPFAGFARLRLRAGLTDYRHDELEDAAVATSFRNQAHDLRAELEHLPVAGWRGVLGLQTTRRDFSALGEEAYVQPTLTQRHALFAVEEYRFGDWRLEAGLRHERQRVAAADSGQQWRGSGSSAALGAVWKFAPGYALAATVTRAQRLPTAEELYADGLHLATATYERGNADLGKETSRNVDLSLRKTGGATTFSASVFRNRVRNYIYARTLDVHDGLQLVEYAQRDVTFTGLEGELRQRLDAVFGLSVFGDLVRARLDGIEGNPHLPRVPARRLGLRLDGSAGPWEGRAELVRVARQGRVAAFETPTPGYTLLNLALSYSTRLAERDWQFYARLDNATDRLALAHTSFIKDAAPLAGRKLTLGARVAF